MHEAHSVWSAGRSVCLCSDHLDRAGRLNNLGNHFLCRYERSGNLQDLEAAIARSQAAVEATPEDHPDRAGRLSNLGAHVSSQYERSGNLQDLEAVIAAYLASWEILSAPVLHCIRAALKAAEILVFRPSVRDVSRACYLLRNAITLMPLLTLRSLD